MYSVYKYPAGSTASGILADIVAILTGETDPESLTNVIKFSQASTNWSSGVGTGFSGLIQSAYIGQRVYVGGDLKGVITANDATTITINESFNAAGVTAVVSPFEVYTSWELAGWEVHDASAGTNAVCIRALCRDGVTYKYVVIDTNTAGKIKLKCYEFWDSSSHTGTNMCYNSDNTGYCQQFSTSGGSLYIHSSQSHIYWQSYQSSVWGSSTYGVMSGVFERTRDGEADTIINGYPPFFWCGGLFTNNGNIGGTHPRILKADGSDGTGNLSFTSCCRYGSSHAISSLASPSPNASDKSVLYPLLPVWFSLITQGHVGGEISSLSGVYIAPYNYGSPLDEFICDGETYVMFLDNNVGSFRSAVIKG